MVAVPVPPQRSPATVGPPVPRFEDYPELAVVDRVESRVDPTEVPIVVGLPVDVVHNVKISGVSRTEPLGDKPVNVIGMTTAGDLVVGTGKRPPPALPPPRAIFCTVPSENT